MEIKIGIQHVQREVVLETDQTSAEIKAKVAAALADGSVLELEDSKGRVTLIPGAQVGYVELGEESKRRIGFGFSE